MNPDDETQVRFGDALKNYVSKNAPSEESVRRRLEANTVDFSGYIDRMAPSPEQLQPRKRQLDPIEITYADDPEELARQQKIRRLDQFSAQLQEQLLQDNPHYYYSMVEPDNEYSRLSGFQKIVSQLSFAAEYNYKREQEIEKELTFWEERRRNLTTAGRVVEFLWSLPQNTASTLVGMTLGGFDEAGRNAYRMATGNDVPYRARYSSDSKWFKFVFGRETERDIFGRVTESKPLEIRSWNARADDYKKWWQESVQGITDPSKATREQDFDATLWMVATTPIMTVLDATDALVIPFAGISATAKGVYLSIRAGKRAVEAMKVIADNAGVAFTKEIEKATLAAMKRARKAGNALDAQRIMNDFVRSIVPEGSDAFRAVNALDQSISIEIAQARTTLDSLAAESPDLPTFQKLVETALQRERNIQTSVLARNAADIESNPAFIAAQNRVEEIFEQFGDAVKPEEIFRAKLRDDAPADIVEEFNRLNEEIADIVENKLVPIANQRAALSDNVPLGTGPFDLTRNLLLDQKKDLPGLLEEVFNAQVGRRTTALNDLKNGPFSVVDAGRVRDSLDTIAREISIARTSGRRFTALNRTADYLAAEDVARGALGRRALLALDEATKVVEPSVKSPKKIPQVKEVVSPVNKMVFDNVYLTAGDTLVKAADDVASAKSYEEFIAKSDQVVWQGERPLLFTRSQSLSDMIVGSEINPEVVLDMKQPLDLLVDADGAAAEFVSRANMGIRVGESISASQAELILKEANQFGFDGIIFTQRLDDGTLTTARGVVTQKQVIPASAFYDNIKGGQEIFGDGISILARREQQLEDQLAKMLPENKIYDSIAKEMWEQGLPRLAATRASMEIHAQLLDTFLDTLRKTSITRRIESPLRLEDGTQVLVTMDQTGIKVAFSVAEGEAKIINVRNYNEMQDLYRKTADNFEQDARKRVEDLKTKQVPGGVTEAKFTAKGEGHKKFNRTLNQRVEEGVFLPEEAMLVRRAMLDVDDAVLRSVPMLESTSDMLGRLGKKKSFDAYGMFSAKRSRSTGEVSQTKITLARGLAYERLRARMRGRTGRGTVNTTGQLSTEIFLHEFGHLAHKTILTAAERKKITDVYRSLTTAERRQFFNRGMADRISTSRYFASSEDEFFAQAFSEYTMRNRLVSEELLPLFQRITAQLRRSLTNLFNRKSNEVTGKVDALNPIFEQILRGQSQTRNSAGRRATDEIIYYKSRDNQPPKSSLNPDPENLKNNKPLINRRAFERNRDLLANIPQGRGLPEDTRRAAIEMAKTPPTPPKGTPTPQNQPAPNMLDAKVPQNILKLDPSKPELADALNPQNVFGKNRKVAPLLRQGQTKLAATARKIQRALTTKDEVYRKKIENLKASRQRAIDTAKQTMKDIDARKKHLINSVRAEEESLAVFGTTFSRAQNKLIANMAAKVKTQKQLEDALEQIYKMADEQYRIEARTRIGKIIEKTKLGTNRIPPFWQEKIEARIGEESIRLKLFRDKYEDRLKKLQEYIDNNPDVVNDFVSPKTLRMLEDLEELKKRAITDFQTSDLVKLTFDIEKIYDQGEAAQFVIKGGKTKEISRPILVVDKRTGEPKIGKFIIQKGGEQVQGLEELWIENQVNFIADAVKRGDVVNLDKDVVMKEYGDLEAAGFGGIMDGLKGLKEDRKNAWMRAYMTYLTSDRSVALMDNMAPDGPMTNLLLKPLRKAINQGEDSAQQTINKWLNFEKKLVEKYGLLKGKPLAGKSTTVQRLTESGFTDANYERIAIYAYVKQGMRNKLLNVMSAKEIDNVMSKGLLPHEKEMYDFMREELDKLYPQVDEIMRDVHGTRLTKVENYFPIQTNVVDNRTMEEVLNIEYIPSKRAVARNFTKQRNPVTGAEIKMNARNIFHKHIRDVNYFVKVESEIQRVAGITRSKNFKKAAGDNTGLWWEQYVDITARRGIPKNYEYGWSDEARTNLGAATLGYNPSPVLKQWLAAFAAIPYVGPLDLVFNGYPFMRRYGLFDAIGKASIEQRLRAADDPLFTQLSLSGKLSQIQEAGYRWIKRTDAGTARGVWIAAYTKQLKKMGKTFNVDDFKNGIGIDQEAVDYADMIVRKSQGSGKFQDLPMFLTNKDKRLWTWLFQFQSFLLSQSQVVTHDAFYSVIRSMQGKSAISFKDAAGFTALTIPAIGGGIVIEQEISRLLTKLYGSEASNERLDEQTGWGRFREGVYSAVPIVGSVAGFLDDDVNTNVPVIDKIIRGGYSAFRAGGAMVDIATGEGTLQDKETAAKEASRVFEAIIALSLGVPGTTFTGGLLRNVGIEPSFKTPSEQLKDAIESGDKADVKYLMEQYQQQGLDIDEISGKTLRAIESDEKADRKKMVGELVKMFKAADTPEEKKELADFIRQGLKDGTITTEHIDDVAAQLKAEGRLESIGEK